MKIWVKYLIGLVLGIIAGIIFSNNSSTAMQAVKPYADIFINIGRYSFYPLVFFSLTIGVHELLLNKKFFVIHRNSFLMIIGTALFSTLIGILTALLFSPERIPVLLEKKAVETIIPLSDQLFSIFPKNLFIIFSDSGNFILPTVFLALLLGVNFNFDKVITKPVVQLFDSLNRITYNINSLILEIMAPGMGFFSAWLFFTVSSIRQIALYKQLFLILFICTAFMIFLVFPAILYITGFKEKPYKYLYAVAGAAIAGFLTGDNYLSSNVLIKHCHENLGISRKAGSVSVTLFAIFGRSGTALVSSVCFILMLKSYSSMDINILQILYVALLIFLVSFTLCSVPGMGVMVLLTIVSAIYGHGIEDGYLMFKPVLPLLLSFAVLVDIVTAGISSMIIAHLEGERNEVEIRDFI
ncbi:MAG: cation:dicarboxylase symporter family transporter [Spirochaetia bacterium]|jgi:Na+/H+-dicarboxylate symporter|nr:cation:dicarboxylase symporter family transporter [Spirochaetia bacterium]